MEMKIHTITEAYSMQPNSFYVGGRCNNIIIARIMLQDIKFVGDPYDAYIGYDADGHKLFEYLKNSVNVTYKPYLTK